MGGRPTRVLLADDHTMYREGLAGLLASYGGLEVVAEVPNGSGTLELVHRRLRPPEEGWRAARLGGPDPERSGPPFYFVSEL